MRVVRASRARHACARAACNVGACFARDCARRAPSPRALAPVSLMSFAWRLPAARADRRAHAVPRCALSPADMLPDLTARDGTTGAVALAAGFALGFLTKHVFHRRLAKLPDYDSDDDDPGFVPASYARANEEHKLVFCVRTDLKMKKGKIAAQVGHATLGAYKAAARRTPTALAVWERNAQPKIAVQIASQREAEMLRNRASKLGLPTYMVFDAGRTQIASCFSHTRVENICREP
ncbi:Peptidyl-tRNA hydrolase 2 [Gracilaria domingensis]|nr:Peptidyl-tRNA hydrolase 2 [Gracilaria domingensis]